MAGLLNLNDEEKDMVGKVLKLFIIGGLNYIRVAKLTDEEIDPEYARVTMEFDAFNPEDIGKDK